MNEESTALMTVDEAAAYLRLAPWILRHWVCKKKIPYTAQCLDHLGDSA